MKPFHVRQNFLVCGIFLCLTLALESTAAGLEAQSQWDDKLDKIDHQLAAGDWQAGQGGARRLLRKMIKRYAAFESSPRPMARAVALLAVAAAGRKDHDVAGWYWAVAHNLDPRATRIDLGAYGPAGKFLSEVPLRAAGQIPKIFGEGARGLRPKHVETPAPAACGALEFSRENPPKPLEVEVLVDAEGQVRSPRLTYPSRFPGFVLTVLEGARSWRFEPAERDGEPVASLATVNVRFPRSRW